ncbi:MoaD/ThiS family protein [Chloroflexota bacterium]
MINVKAESIAPISDLIKNRIIEMEDGATLKDLIDRLISEGGKKLEELIIDPDTNEVLSSCPIIMSGRVVNYSEERMTKLKDNDVVVVLPGFFIGG